MHKYNIQGDYTSSIAYVSAYDNELEKNNNE
jgi:hypothetical protein